jgi:hypothetical protein
MTDVKYNYFVPSFPNPYPASDVDVRGFEYDDKLLLMRLPEAPVTNNGAKADFVVGADFSARGLGSDGVTRRITVPRGMMTDLTSVPPGFRWLIGRVGPWLEAAIVHDFLTIAWRTMDGQGSRARRNFADAIMVAAMKRAGVGIRKSFISFGIRIAAGISYPQTVDPRTQTRLYIDLDKH